MSHLRTGAMAKMPIWKNDTKMLIPIPQITENKTKGTYKTWSILATHMHMVIKFWLGTLQGYVQFGKESDIFKNDRNGTFHEKTKIHWVPLTTSKKMQKKLLVISGSSL